MQNFAFLFWKLVLFRLCHCHMKIWRHTVDHMGLGMCSPKYQKLTIQLTEKHHLHSSIKESLKEKGREKVKVAQTVKCQVESWSRREDKGRALGTDHTSPSERSKRGDQERETGYQMPCWVFEEENEALAQVTKCQERRQLGHEQDGFTSEPYLSCISVVVRNKVVCCWPGVLIFSHTTIGWGVLGIKHYQCQNCSIRWRQYAGDVSHATQAINAIRKAVYI